MSAGSIVVYQAAPFLGVSFWIGFSFSASLLIWIALGHSPEDAVRGIPWPLRVFLGAIWIGCLLCSAMLMGMLGENGQAFNVAFLLGVASGLLVGYLVQRASRHRGR